MSGENSQTSPAQNRRKLSFKSNDAMVADVRHLRSAGYQKLGQWSLPQILQHLSGIMLGSLKMPASSAPATAEQTQKKDAFLAMILAEGGPPPLVAPPATQPSPDASDEQFDRFEKAAHEVDAWPHPFAEIGGFGPVPMNEVRALHRAHASHHLSFLIPNDVRRTPPNFVNETAAIAEIERLRKHGYTQAGHWTLAQICYHCNVPLRASLEAPMSLNVTPEQQKARGFLENVNTQGWPEAQLPSAQFMVPPATVAESVIDDFIANLRNLEHYPHSHVSSAIFGPLDVAQARRFNLIHLAHHLSFLQPKVARRVDLKFATVDDCIADVKRLRKGSVQSGNWTFPQACWHLNHGVQSRMRDGPFPPDTDEQKARKGALAQVLATGRLPDGLSAPTEMTPPADAGDAAIDALLDSLTKFKAWTKPLPPHRIFGELSQDDARRLNLIHCAHHLSYFVPTTAG